MEFLGKMCLKINFNVTKKQCFTLSLEDTVFENSQGRGEGGNCPPAFLGLKIKS